MVDPTGTRTPIPQLSSPYPVAIPTIIIIIIRTTTTTIMMVIIIITTTNQQTSGLLAGVYDVRPQVQKSHF
jgi:hypothetical protein